MFWRGVGGVGDGGGDTFPLGPKTHTNQTKKTPKNKQQQHSTHHGNHGHVENDESWHPTTKSQFDAMDNTGKLGRLKFPAPLFAYPFYLWARSPGKQGSHYDPSCDLFVPSERPLVLTTNACLIGFLGVLAACTAKLGVAAMFNLYFVPYWVFVAWLDVVTYLHHHGSDNVGEKMPWYRGAQWSYLRGGLTTLDRDYGVFNKIQHDIGTHVVHHLFPQVWRCCCCLVLLCGLACGGVRRSRGCFFSHSPLQTKSNRSRTTTWRRRPRRPRR